MTTLDCNTQQQTMPVFVLPDWGANIAAAQRAGDGAYIFAQRAGASLAEQSVAYHVAFADTMRELGTPMPCPCDLCMGGERQEVTQ
jgi:hypothetical protein